MFHRIRLASCALTVLLMAGLVTAVWAQSEGPTTAAKPLPAATAKIGIIKPGAASVKAAPEVARPPASAEEKALQAIQDEGVRQVVDLSKQADALPDGPARRALESKIVDLKRDTFLSLVRTKGEFARARGDMAGVRQSEAIVEAILHPQATKGIAVSRPVPNAAEVKKSGGQQ